MARGSPGDLGGCVFLKHFVRAYTKDWSLSLGGMCILTIMDAPRRVLGALRDWGRRRAA